MLRKILFVLALGASAWFCAASSALAQVQPPRVQLPRMDGLPPELQREIERMQRELDEAFKGGMMQPRQAIVRTGSGLRWGGAQLKKLTPEMQEKLGLLETEGLMIAAVDANSPSQKAGLRANDVLVDIGAKRVMSDPNTFVKTVKDLPPNENMDLVIIREGVQVTLEGAKMPTTAQFAPADGLNGRPNMPFPRFQMEPFRPGFLGGPGVFRQAPPFPALPPEFLPLLPEFGRP